ncbi:MAG TPA: rRNA maturation RNase YbeY [Flavobacteriia bacterium]|nr:rRNA maturation RNase YbeY [Flavobacteriia bacterium]
MISFNYEIEFRLVNIAQIANWISHCITEESCKEGTINYILVSDEYLSQLNVKYLKHNTLTDIISFDDSIGKVISGDIYISAQRVEENAKLFNVSFEDELHRVMIHGILHFCGYNDKTESQKKTMRKKEDYYLSLRDF